MLLRKNKSVQISSKQFFANEIVIPLIVQFPIKFGSNYNGISNSLIFEILDSAL